MMDKWRWINAPVHDFFRCSSTPGYNWQTGHQPAENPIGHVIDLPALGNRGQKFADVDGPLAGATDQQQGSLEWGNPTQIIQPSFRITLPLGIIKGQKSAACNDPGLLPFLLPADIDQNSALLQPLRKVPAHNLAITCFHVLSFLSWLILTIQPARRTTAGGMQGKFIPL